MDTYRRRISAGKINLKGRKTHGQGTVPADRYPLRRGDRRRARPAAIYSWRKQARLPADCRGDTNRQLGIQECSSNAVLSVFKVGPILVSPL
jgi:hypothetical protein